MLKINHQIGFGVGGAVLRNFFEILTDLSLTTNLELCLDAGALASYDGTGQVWKDLSGAGADFNRGATSSPSSDDPTFNGSPGAVSMNEYWSFDGGDFFRYDSANETWMENQHKDNALFSVAAWVYRGTSNIGAICGCGSSVGGGNIGSALLTSGNKIEVNRVTSPRAIDIELDDAPNTNVWNFLGVSLDEASGGGGSFGFLNGAYNQLSGSDTWDGTYFSPSADSASFTYEISGCGNATRLMPSDARLAIVAIWSTGLSKSDFDEIWTETRGRFGV